MTDTDLMGLAEIAAGLLGLFLVGVVFYLDAGERSRDLDEVGPYLRSSTRIVLMLYAMPVALPLLLVASSPSVATAAFVTMSVLLVVANVATVRDMRASARAMPNRVLLTNEVAGTLGVAAVVIGPWLTGRGVPGRHDLVSAALIALGVGFLSTGTLVLSLFDIRGRRGDVRPSDGDTLVATVSADDVPTRSADAWLLPLRGRSVPLRAADGRLALVPALGGPAPSEWRIGRDEHGITVFASATGDGSALPGVVWVDPAVADVALAPHERALVGRAVRAVELGAPSRR